MTLFFILLKIIENNYMPSSVRVTCPATDCDKEKFKTYRDGQQYIERTVTCPCCNKSFLIEGHYATIAFPSEDS